MLCGCVCVCVCKCVWREGSGWDHSNTCLWRHTYGVCVCVCVCVNVVEGHSATYLLRQMYVVCVCVYVCMCVCVWGSEWGHSRFMETYV